MAVLPQSWSLTHTWCILATFAIFVIATIIATNEYYQVAPEVRQFSLPDGADYTEVVENLDEDLDEDEDTRMTIY